ncbi:MAG: hypothetical protein ACI81R_000695 [Bradymonadia bacterium]|jgi:hypothetical protein
MHALRCFSFAAVLLFGLMPSAHASHYFVADIEFIDDVTRAEFVRFGYDDTEEVLRGLLTPDARERVADATGLAIGELTEIARICELLQVRGIGPKAASLLIAAGVFDVGALAGYEPGSLVAELEVVNSLGQYTNVNPHFEVVQQWIISAADAPYRVEY